MKIIRGNVQRVTQIDSASKIIMDAVPVGVMVFDSDARIIYVNPSASKIFAKPATEVSGLRFGDFIGCINRHKNPQGCGCTKSCVHCSIFRDLSLSVSDELKEVMEEAEACLERDTGLCNTWVKYRVSSFMMENSKFAILTVENIADRKQTYELTALRKNGTTFPGQIQGKMIQFQDRPIRVTALRDITERKKTESQMEEALKELREYKVHLEELEDQRTSDLRKSNTELKQEIAARKQAEEALGESEEKHRKITESISDVVWVSDLNLKTIYVSPSVENLLGEPADLHTNRALEEKFPPDSLDKIKAIFTNEMEKDKDPRSNKNRGRLIELQHYRADGSVIWVSINASFIRDKNGMAIGIQGVTRDISERKKVEEELRQSKRFLETVFDSIQDGICVLDTTLNIVVANKKMEKWYSHMLPLVGKKCYEAYHQRSIPCKDCPTSRALETGKLEMVEHPLKQEDINVGTVELYAFPILDDTGKPAGVVEYIRNITERKRAEAATQEAHQRLIAVLDSMDAGVYVADMETYELLFVNRYMQNIYGNVIGKKCWQVLQEGKTGPCEFCTNHRLLDAAGQPGGVYQWENYKTKTGRWYECRDNALRWIDGRMVRMGIAFDITDRKQAEEFIKTSLREKETLLKEVHHRVKNNMQVISSLLNLQITRNKDEQARKALMDCRGRIGSMACVHEMLYISDSLAIIDCQAYISKLTKDIMRSYQTDPHRIKMTVDAKGVTLGIQQASPLGLIINELLSNALKYGFPENILGRIMIRLKLCENNIVKLVFSDNGIGIPEDLDWRNTKSLGLNLIVLLTENQLGGTVNLYRQEDTCFTIKFNRENNY